MGRNKIEIKPVEDPNARQITFCKRRKGLFKKANELSILCGTEIAAIVFSPGNKPYSFGHPDVDSVAAEFLQQDQGSSSSKDSNLEELMEQQLIGLKNQSCEEEPKKGLQEMHESMAELRCKIRERLNEMEVVEALLLLKEQPVEFVDNNRAGKRKRRNN